MNEPKLEIVEEFGGLAIRKYGPGGNVHRVFISKSYLPALRKHLNEGMEEVSVYAGKARTRGRIWSESSPDAESAVRILVPAGGE